MKKKIPLLALEKIEPFLLKDNDFFQITTPGDFLLKFIDKDNDSDYYFIIEQYKIESSKLQLLLNYKPQSQETVENYRVWTNGEILDQVFADWLKLLERYSKVKTIYDDPIEKKYKEEFYTEYEIVDEDASTISFNIEQQLWLDSYLEKVINILDSFDETNPMIIELKSQVIELKDNLTTLTKKKIIEKLSWIWAKSRKIGLPILKQIYIEIRYEIIKQLVEGNINIIKGS
jgi:hypothetical protein